MNLHYSDVLLPKGTTLQPALGFVTNLGVTGLWLDESGAVPAIVVQVGAATVLRVKDGVDAITVGAGASGRQIRFGTGGLQDSFGMRYSAGDAYLASNAMQSVSGQDLWTMPLQSDTAAGAALFVQGNTAVGSILTVARSAPRSANGTYANFWSPLVTVGHGGQVYAVGGYGLENFPNADADTAGPGARWTTNAGGSTGYPWTEGVGLRVDRTVPGFQALASFTLWSANISDDALYFRKRAEDGTVWGPWQTMVTSAGGGVGNRMAVWSGASSLTYRDWEVGDLGGMPVLHGSMGSANSGASVNFYADTESRSVAFGSASGPGGGYLAVNAIQVLPNEDFWFSLDAALPVGAIFLDPKDTGDFFSIRRGIAARSRPAVPDARLGDLPTMFSQPFLTISQAGDTTLWGNASALVRDLVPATTQRLVLVEPAGDLGTVPQTLRSVDLDAFLLLIRPSFAHGLYAHSDVDVPLPYPGGTTPGGDVLTYDATIHQWRNISPGSPGSHKHPFSEVLFGHQLRLLGRISPDTGFGLPGEEISVDVNLQLSGQTLSVLSAPKWTTARTMTYGGDTVGTVTFDGSGNSTVNLLVAQVTSLTYANAHAALIGKFVFTVNAPGATSYPNANAGVGLRAERSASAGTASAGSFLVWSDSTTGKLWHQYFDGTVWSPWKEFVFGGGWAAPVKKVNLTPMAAGIATTFLQSDAQLELDQTIAPHWTGIHCFQAGVRFGSGVDPAGDTTVHFAAGTAGRVPARFTLSGASLLATPVAGSLETDAARPWWTDSAGVRRRVLLEPRSGSPSEPGATALATGDVLIWDGGFWVNRAGIVAGTGTPRFLPRWKDVVTLTTNELENSVWDADASTPTKLKNTGLAPIQIEMGSSGTFRPTLFGNIFQSERGFMAVNAKQTLNADSWTQGRSNTDSFASAIVLGVAASAGTPVDDVFQVNYAPPNTASAPFSAFWQTLFRVSLTGISVRAPLAGTLTATTRVLVTDTDPSSAALAVKNVDLASLLGGIGAVPTVTTVTHTSANTAHLTIGPVATQALSGNVAWTHAVVSAPRWATARTLSWSKDAVGSMSVDGTNGVDAPLTVNWSNGTTFYDAKYALTTHNHAGVYEPVIALGTASKFWSWDKTWRDVGWTLIVGKPSTFPPDPHTLGFHSDVSLSGTVANDSVLVYNGTISRWTDQRLVVGQVLSAVGASPALIATRIPVANASYQLGNSSLTDNSIKVSTTLPFEAFRLGSGPGDMAAPGIYFTGYAGKTGLYAPARNQICFRLDDGSTDGSHPRFCVGPDRISTTLPIESPSLLVNGRVVLQRVSANYTLTAAAETEIFNLTTPAAHANTQYFLQVVLQQVASVNQVVTLRIYANGTLLNTQGFNTRASATIDVSFVQQTPGIDTGIVWRVTGQTATSTVAVGASDQGSGLAITMFSPPWGGAGGSGGGLTGTGVSGRLARWTGATNLDTALIYDDTVGVGVGAGPLAGELFTVHGDTTVVGALTKASPVANLAALPVWVNEGGLFKSQPLANLKSNLAIVYGDIGGTVPLASHGLGQHTDVTITAPATGHFLRYNSVSAKWLNEAVAIPIGANPTAMVGTVAVVGSSVSFMRSDAAPPVDQAIVPLWTSKHTFSGTNSGIAVRVATAGTLATASRLAVFDADASASALDLKQATLAQVQAWLAHTHPYTDVILTGPRLVGKSTAGSGPAEQIATDANLLLSAQTISVLSAPKWTNIRSLAWSGSTSDATGSMLVDGTGDVTSALTVLWARGTNTYDARYALAGHTHAGVYEPVVAPGTASKFWAWDKTFKDVDWAYITGKPTTFPSGTHTHTYTDVVGIVPTSFLGRVTAGTGAAEMLTVGPTLSFSGTVLGVVSAPRWTTARTLSWSKDATGSMSVTGAGDTDAPLTVVWANGTTFYDAKYALTTHSHSGVYEPVIVAGAASKFWAWDKTFKDVDWTYITGKPATFPSGTHTHNFADVIGIVPTSFLGRVTAGTGPAEMLTVGPTLSFSGTVMSVASAPKWTTARTLAWTGDAVGSMSVDGNSGATAAMVVTWANGTTFYDGRYALTTHTHAGVYEPVIAPGTASKFWAWDKTFKDVDWAYITGKPSTFPSGTHTHNFADVIGVVPTSFLGRVTAGTGAAEMLTVGPTLTFSGTTMSVASAPRWTTARTLSWSKDAVGSMSVTGTGDTDAPLTVVWANGTTFYDAKYALTTHTHAGVYEPVIASSTASKFWSWDKTFRDIDWAYIVNKPATFPSGTHTHNYADVIGVVPPSFLGRTTAGTGPVELLNVGPTLAFTGTTLGVVSAPKWTNPVALQWTSEVTGSMSVDGATTPVSAATTVNRAIVPIWTGKHVFSATVPAVALKAAPSGTLGASAQLLVVSADPATTVRDVMGATLTDLGTWLGVGNYLDTSGTAQTKTGQLTINSVTVGAAAPASGVSVDLGFNNGSWVRDFKVKASNSGGSLWSMSGLAVSGTNETATKASIYVVSGVSSALASGSGSVQTQRFDFLPSGGLVFQKSATVSGSLAMGSSLVSTPRTWILPDDDGTLALTKNVVPSTATVTLNAGSNITITGATTQLLTSNPAWTITASALAASKLLPLFDYPNAVVTPTEAHVLGFLNTTGSTGYPNANQSGVGLEVVRHATPASMPGSFQFWSGLAGAELGKLYYRVVSDAVPTWGPWREVSFTGLHTHPYTDITGLSSPILLGRTTPGGGAAEQVVAASTLLLASGTLSVVSAPRWTAPAVLQWTSEVTGSMSVDGFTTPVSAATSINRAIAPTWTGKHIFSAGPPSIAIKAADAGTLAPTGVLLGLGASGATTQQDVVGLTQAAVQGWVGLSNYVPLTKTIELIAGTGISITPVGQQAMSGVLQWTITNTAAGSSIVPGSPTASVGLSVVNGVAATYMRSDAAPPLSQSIAPTWTGKHIFAAATPAIAVRAAVSTAHTHILTTVGDPGAGAQDVVAALKGSLLALNDLSDVTVTLSGTGQVLQYNGTVWTNGTLVAGMLPTHTHSYTEVVAVPTGRLLGRTSPLAGVTEPISVDANLSLSGQVLGVLSAPKWTSARTATWTNDVTGSMSMDGSANVSSAMTVVWANGKLTYDGFYVPLVRTLTLNAGTGISVSPVGAQSLSADRTWTITNTGAASAADPTASVGLVAINGTLATYMRSDAAPALSQGIVPTWTGKHTFNAAVPSIATKAGAATLAAGSVVFVADADATATAQNVKTATLGGLRTWLAIPASADTSASVGLIAVNGVAATFMRSDAAPPLSQGIVPTWTGKHSFTAATTALRAPAGGLGINSRLLVTASDPAATQQDVASATLADLNGWLGTGNFLDTSGTAQTKTGQLTVNGVSLGIGSPTVGVSVNLGYVAGPWARDFKLKASNSAGTAWSLVGLAALASDEIVTKAVLYVASSVPTASAILSGYNQTPRYEFYPNGDFCFVTPALATARLTFSAAVNNQTWTLPNVSGTIALGVGTALRMPRWKSGSINEIEASNWDATDAASATKLKYIGAPTTGYQSEIYVPVGVNVAWGSRYSSGAAFMSANARQTSSGTDAWDMPYQNASSGGVYFGGASGVAGSVFEVRWAPPLSASNTFAGFFTNQLLAVSSAGDLSIRAASTASPSHVLCVTQDASGTTLRQVFETSVTTFLGTLQHTSANVSYLTISPSAVQQAGGILQWTHSVLAAPKLLTVALTDANAAVVGGQFFAYTTSAGSTGYPATLGGGVQYERTANDAGAFQLWTEKTSSETLWWRKMNAPSAWSTWKSFVFTERTLDHISNNTLHLQITAGPLDLSTNRQWTHTLVAAPKLLPMVGIQDAAAIPTEAHVIGFLNSGGSTGYPNTAGVGLEAVRSSLSSSIGGTFQFWSSTVGAEIGKLYWRAIIDSTPSWGPWREISFTGVHTHPYTDINNIPSQRLVGRYSSGTGAAEAISTGYGLIWNTSVLSVNTQQVAPVSYVTRLLLASGAGTARWVRLATNGPLVYNSPSAGGGSQTGARFVLRDAAAGLHGHCVFHAGVNYGGHPTLMLLEQHRYGGAQSIRRLRLSYGLAYDGAALDAEIVGAEGIDGYLYCTMHENYATAGWTLVALTEPADVPASFSSIILDLQGSTVTAPVLAVVTKESLAPYSVLRSGAVNAYSLGLTGDLNAGGNASVTGTATVTGLSNLGGVQVGITSPVWGIVGNVGAGSGGWAMHYRHRNINAGLYGIGGLTVSGTGNVTSRVTLFMASAAASADVTGLDGFPKYDFESTGDFVYNKTASVKGTLRLGQNTVTQSWTLPDKTGTVALTSDVFGLKLDDLTDVVVTTPVAGNILRYDGSQWVNILPGAGSGLVPDTRALTHQSADANLTISPVGAQNLSTDRIWTHTVVSAPKLVSFAIPSSGTLLPAEQHVQGFWHSSGTGYPNGNTTGVGLDVFRSGTPASMPGSFQFWSGLSGPELGKLYWRAVVTTTPTWGSWHELVFADTGYTHQHQYTDVIGVPTARLLGRTTAGIGVAEPISTDANLSLASLLLSVVSAPKWTSPQTLSWSKDVTGSMSVDGSIPKDAPLTVIWANGTTFYDGRYPVSTRLLTHQSADSNLLVSAPNAQNLTADRTWTYTVVSAPKLMAVAATDANAAVLGGQFFAYLHGAGSTNYPATLGGGFQYERGANDTGAFQIWTEKTVSETLWWRKMTAPSTWSTWKSFVFTERTLDHISSNSLHLQITSGPLDLSTNRQWTHSVVAAPKLLPMVVAPDATLIPTEAHILGFVQAAGTGTGYPNNNTGGGVGLEVVRSAAASSMPGTFQFWSGYAAPQLGKLYWRSVATVTPTWGAWHELVFSDTGYTHTHNYADIVGVPGDVGTGYLLGRWAGTTGAAQVVSTGYGLQWNSSILQVNAQQFAPTTVVSRNISGVGAGAVRWVRLAYFGPLVYNSGSISNMRAGARFVLWDQVSGVHGHCVFTAGINYGSYPTLVLNEQHRYGGVQSIRRVRLSYGLTYDGAALDVEVVGIEGANNVFTCTMLENYATTGWVMTALTEPADVPASFSTVILDLQGSTTTTPTIALVTKESLAVFSVLRTGAVNAFSLGLTGDLSVGGNSTVSGTSAVTGLSNLGGVQVGIASPVWGAVGNAGVGNLAWGMHYRHRNLNAGLYGIGGLTVSGSGSTTNRVSLFMVSGNASADITGLDGFPRYDLESTGDFVYNNSASLKGTLRMGQVTATRSWTLPDATGTVALTSDVLSLSLDSLTDVTVTTPAVGHILRYNGTQWVNLLPGAGSGLVPDTRSLTHQSADSNLTVTAPNTQDLTADRTWTYAIQAAPKLTVTSRPDANGVLSGLQFFAYFNTTGSTNYPAILGGGFQYERTASGAGTFQIWTESSVSETLWWRKLTAASTWSTWKSFVFTERTLEHASANTAHLTITAGPLDLSSNRLWTHSVVAAPKLLPMASLQDATAFPTEAHVLGFLNSGGSTGYPDTAGVGLEVVRSGTTGSMPGTYQIWSSTSGTNVGKLFYRAVTSSTPTWSVWHEMVTADNGYAHTHNFVDVLGVPAQTLLGRWSGTPGAAQAVTTGYGLQWSSNILQVNAAALAPIDYTTGTLAAGQNTWRWVRLAYIGSLDNAATGGGGRASARFIVRAYGSGMHDRLDFHAGVNYGTQPTLILQGLHAYSSQSIRKIRITEGSTWAGATVDLEIIGHPSGTVVFYCHMHENYETPGGWILQPFLEPATVPAGFSSWEFDLTMQSTSADVPVWGAVTENALAARLTRGGTLTVPALNTSNLTATNAATTTLTATTFTATNLFTSAINQSPPLFVATFGSDPTSTPSRLTSTAASYFLDTSGSNQTKAGQLIVNGVSIGTGSPVYGVAQDYGYVGGGWARDYKFRGTSLDGTLWAMAGLAILANNEVTQRLSLFMASSVTSAVAAGVGYNLTPRYDFFPNGDLVFNLPSVAAKLTFTASVSRNWVLPNASGTIALGTGTTSMMSRWKNANELEATTWDASDTNPTKLRYLGAPTSGIQTEITSGAGLNVAWGGRYSSGSFFAATNARQVTNTTDLWEMPYQQAASNGIYIGASVTTTSFEIRLAPPLSSQGAFAAFFSSQLFSINSSGDATLLRYLTLKAQTTAAETHVLTFTADASGTARQVNQSSISEILGGAGGGRSALASGYVSYWTGSGFANTNLYHNTASYFELRSPTGVGVTFRGRDQRVALPNHNQPDMTFWALHHNALMCPLWQTVVPTIFETTLDGGTNWTPGTMPAEILALFAGEYEIPTGLSVSCADGTNGIRVTGTFASRLCTVAWALYLSGGWSNVVFRVEVEQAGSWSDALPALNIGSSGWPGWNIVNQAFDSITACTRIRISFTFPTDTAKTFYASVWAYGTFSLATSRKLFWGTPGTRTFNTSAANFGGDVAVTGKITTQAALATLASTSRVLVVDTDPATVGQLVKQVDATAFGNWLGPFMLGNYMTLGTNQDVTGTKTWTDPGSASKHAIETKLTGVVTSYHTMGGALWLADELSIKTTAQAGTANTQLLVADSSISATAPVKSMTKANLLTWTGALTLSGSGTVNRIPKWTVAGTSLGSSSFIESASYMQCDLPLVAIGQIQGQQFRVMPYPSAYYEAKRHLGHGYFYAASAPTGNILVKLPITVVSGNNVMARFDIQLIDHRPGGHDTVLSVSGYTFYSSATVSYWYGGAVKLNNPASIISKVKLGYDKTDNTWCVCIKPTMAWSYPNVHVDAFVGYQGSNAWDRTSTAVSLVDDAYYANNIKATNGTEYDPEFVPTYSLDTSSTSQTKAGPLIVQGMVTANGVNIGTASPASGVAVDYGYRSGGWVQDFKVRASNSAGTSWAMMGLSCLGSIDSVQYASIYLISNYATPTASGYNLTPRFDFLPSGNFAFIGATASGTFSMGSTTAGRTWTLPDKSGTVAMTSDIVGGGGNVTGSGRGMRLVTFSGTKDQAGSTGITDIPIWTNGTSIEFVSFPAGMSNLTVTALFGRDASSGILKEIDKTNLLNWLNIGSGIAYPGVATPNVADSGGWKPLVGSTPVTVSLASGTYSVGITSNYYASFSHTHVVSEIAPVTKSTVLGRNEVTNGTCEMLTMGSGLSISGTTLYNTGVVSVAYNGTGVGMSNMAGASGNVTIAPTWLPQLPALVLASGATGTVAPTFRQLVATDLNATGANSANVLYGDMTWRALPSPGISFPGNVGVPSVADTAWRQLGVTFPITLTAAAGYSIGFNDSAYVKTTTSVTGANSITGGGGLDASRTFSLVGDVASPGTGQYYGTPSGGGTTRGWYNLPSVGGGGNVTGSGTVNTVAMWSGSTTNIGNSPITVSGTVVTIPALSVSGTSAFAGASAFNSTVTFSTSDQTVVDRLYGRAGTGGGMVGYTTASVATALGLDSKVNGSGTPNYFAIWQNGSTVYAPTAMYLSFGPNAVQVDSTYNFNVGGANNFYIANVKLPQPPTDTLFYGLRANGSSGATWQVIASSGTGTVTLVAMLPPANFNLTGSPITTSGTLSMAWNNQAANTVLAGPQSGAPLSPGFRSLVPLDLASGPTNGYVLGTNGSALSWVAPGGLTGGATGALAKWSSPTTLATSIISESGTVVTVAGSLDCSVNQISAANIRATQYFVYRTTGGVTVNIPQFPSDVSASKVWVLVGNGSGFDWAQLVGTGTMVLV